jgi:Ser/Thr protein kinase RdoA (MazF antagonist)
VAGQLRLAGASPPVLINLSENATYRIEDRPPGGASPCGSIVRAITEKRHRLRARLAAGASNDGVVITLIPVPGSDGDLIQSVGHPAMARPRNVVLFKWEEGRSHRRRILTEKFKILGEVAAKMHLHSQTGGVPRISSGMSGIF